MAAGDREEPEEAGRQQSAGAGGAPSAGTEQRRRKTRRLGCRGDGVGRGKEVLDTILGSQAVSRTVADHASARTGIGAGELKALLPMADALAADAIARQGGPGVGGKTGALSRMLGGRQEPRLSATGEILASSMPTVMETRRMKS